jgi:hypothetical protein
VTDGGNHRRRLIRDLEIRFDRLGAPEKQLNGCVLRERVQWRQLVEVREWQGRHGVDLLAMDAQAFTAGDQNPQFSACHEQV